MKRSRLRRITPLQNSVPLARHAPLRSAGVPLARSTLARSPEARAPHARSPMRRTPPRAKLTSRQRKPVHARSGGRCEIALDMCLRRATDTAHRLGEGMGGRHGDAAEVSDRPSNVLHACRLCHRWCHDHPSLALGFGWMLRTGDDPAVTPVLYRAEQWVLLGDDGSLIQYEFGEPGEVG